MCVVCARGLFEKEVRCEYIHEKKKELEDLDDLRTVLEERANA
jgi:hypothetical protein